MTNFYLWFISNFSKVAALVIYILKIIFSSIKLKTPNIIKKVDNLKDSGNKKKSEQKFFTNA